MLKIEDYVNIIKSVDELTRLGLQFHIIDENSYEIEGNIKICKSIVTELTSYKNIIENNDYSKEQILKAIIMREEIGRDVDDIDGL